MTKTKSTKKGAGTLKKAGIWAVPTVMVWGGMLWAAEGLTGQLTIGQSLRYENNTGTTNTDDEGFASNTDIGLQLTSETRSQKLEFSLNGALRYSDGNSKFSLEDPSARLSYALESKNALLSFEGSYRRVDIDDTAFLLDPLDPNSNIITGDGNRTITGLRTTLTLGRDAPLSTEITHFYGQTRYSGTTAPTLVNTTTQEIGVRFSYEIDPTVTVSLFADQREFDAAGPGSSDRDTTRVGAGVDYAITPSLTASVELSYSKIDTDDNAGTSSSRDGINASFELTKELPNGNLGFSLSEEETVNGKRRQINLSRSLEWQRGTLSLSLGATKTDGFDVEPLVSANANYEIDQASQLSLGLSQSANVNDDNEESINTRLSISYSRELTDLSSLSAELSLVDRNAQSVANGDQTSTRFNLSYRHELANDFNLVTSYRYSRTKRDGQANRKNTVISLGLEKTFDFRP